MALFKIENLSFTYPGQAKKALDSLSLELESGDFICLCGRSGSGKSTLLRQLKPSLTPHGVKEGSLDYRGRKLGGLDQEEDVKIGYVFQDPDNQIVTDKVWHELAFGLENLGLNNETIRLRVGEMASFFGIQNWFHKDVGELSGGQKQILNLASVMAMDPDILILDEPTSQLDPIASRDFLDMLKRINEDLATTILISEHRLEEVLPMVERLLVLDQGRLIYDGPVRESLGHLKDEAIFSSLPTSMQIYQGLGAQGEVPINVKEGRSFIGQYLKEDRTEGPEREEARTGEKIIEVRECFFRYDKRGPDVIKDLNLDIEKGTIHSILGGNGTGKSTCLFMLANIYQPYRGRIRMEGTRLAKAGNRVIMLPQDPKSLFIENQVAKEIYQPGLEGEKLDEMVDFMDLGSLLDHHPYDLSGGEQQRLALAKVLLRSPEVLLLDEVTKGLDGEFKDRLGHYLLDLRDQGLTIVMVSHDIEFCAKYSDRSSLFFDGGVLSTERTRDFFAGNNFYTSKANRMVRNYRKDAITVEDVIDLCKS